MNAVQTRTFAKMAASSLTSTIVAAGCASAGFSLPVAATLTGLAAIIIVNLAISRRVQGGIARSPVRHPRLGGGFPGSMGRRRTQAPASRAGRQVPNTPDLYENYRSEQ